MVHLKPVFTVCRLDAVLGRKHSSSSILGILAGWQIQDSSVWKAWRTYCWSSDALERTIFDFLATQTTTNRCCPFTAASERLLSGSMSSMNYWTRPIVETCNRHKHWRIILVSSRETTFTKCIRRINWTKQGSRGIVGIRLEKIFRFVPTSKREKGTAEWHSVMPYIQVLSKSNASRYSNHYILYQLFRAIIHFYLNFYRESLFNNQSLPSDIKLMI